MSKKIRLGIDALKKIQKGVNALANAVKVTLGPSGRTVILYRGLGSNHVTKDGATVAKDVDLEDSVENMAASLVKQTAEETADLAGDGTSTSIVLIQALFNEAYKVLVKKKKFFGLIKERFSSVNPMEFKKGMELAVKDVIDNLKLITTKITTVEEVKNIALVSSNGDKSMSNILHEVYAELGLEAKITRSSEPSQSGLDEHNITKGFVLDRGYASPSFTNEKDNTICRLKNPIFALIPGTLSNPEVIIPYLETSFVEKRPLIVVADDFDFRIMDMLIKNNLNPKSSSILAIKTPGMGGNKSYNLEDLSAVLGYNNKITPEVITSLKGSNLGKCEEIICNSHETTIVVSDTNKEKLDNHLTFLRSSLESEIGEYSKELLKTRISKLEGKIVVISLYSRTDGEFLERLDRIDDAIEATKSAIEEGYISGGGLPLYRISSYLQETGNYKSLSKDKKLGYLSVLTAIKEPFNSIIRNSGLDPIKVYNDIPLQYLNKKPLPYNGYYTVGYNSKTGTYENLILKGVIDPVKVTRIALKNAESTSGALITTGCTISLN